MTILAVEHRVHVTTAGQEEAVESTEDFSGTLTDLEHAWTSAGLFDRRHVVIEAAAAADADDRFHHIFTGTVHPISSRARVS